MNENSPGVQGGSQSWVPNLGDKVFFEKDRDHFVHGEVFGKAVAFGIFPVVAITDEDGTHHLANLNEVHKERKQ